MKLIAWGGVLLVVAATVLLVTRPKEGEVTVGSGHSASEFSMAVLSANSTPTPTLIPLLPSTLYSTTGISPHHSSASAMLRELSGKEPPTYSGGAETIDSANEAISLTLTTELPSRFTPTTVVARLLSRSTFEEDFLDYSPGEYDGSLGPVWVVAVTASGMTKEDVLSAGAPVPSYTPPASKIVPGAFYAWDANRSTIQARGVLHDSGTRTISGLSDLANESVTIATATDLPFAGTPAASVFDAPTVLRGQSCLRVDILDPSLGEPCNDTIFQTLPTGLTCPDDETWLEVAISLCSSTTAVGRMHITVYSDTLGSPDSVLVTDFFFITGDRPVDSLILGFVGEAKSIRLTSDADLSCVQLSVYCAEDDTCKPSVCPLPGGGANPSTTPTPTAIATPAIATPTTTPTSAAAHELSLPRLHLGR